MKTGDEPLYSILQTIPALTYRDELDGTRSLRFVSPECRKDLGLSEEVWMAHPEAWIERLHGDDREETLSMLASEHRSSPCTLEYRLLSTTGRPIWFRDLSVLRQDTLGRPSHFEGLLIDITDFKETEASLQLHSKRLSALREVEKGILAARSPEDTARVVLEHIRQIVPCSRASVTLFDFQAGRFTALAAVFQGKSQFRSGAHLPLEMLKKEVELLERGEIVHVPDIDDLPAPSLHIQKLKEEGMRTFAYVPLRAQDQLIGALNLGDNAPSVFTAEHLQIARELADIMAIAIEQARLFQSTREQSEQLRQLAFRLTEIEGVERKHLAEELHDRVGQNLTAIQLQLSIIRTALPSGTEPALGPRLDDALRLLEETTAHVRGVMVELRPQVLDDYGLVAALDWYARQFARRTGIEVRVQGEDLDPRLPDPVEMTLFRIAQEALNNAAKHAEASRVDITVEDLEDTVEVRFFDDGNGIDPKRLRARSGSAGMGLLTMKERAARIHAAFRLDSRLGQGTRIVLAVRR